MAPLARERRHVTGFISNSAKVARATAERRAALEETLQKFPRFLDELRPTMARLGSFADDIDAGRLRPRRRGGRHRRAAQADGSRSRRPRRRRWWSSAKTAEPGIPAISASIPIVKDLRAFAKQLKPVGATLADLLTSFQKNDGLERFLDYVYYQATAVNGFDSIGHYLRAGLLVNTCSTYSVDALQGCAANFAQTPSTGTASSAGGDRTLQATSAVLNGAKPDEVLSAAELDEVKRQTAAEQARR